MSSINKDFDERSEQGKKKKYFNLEIKRIEDLLENCSEKLLFALTIPALLLHELNVITTYLSEVEMNLVEKAFCKYLDKHTRHFEFKKDEERIDFISIHDPRALEKYFNDYEPKYEAIPKTDEYNISKAVQILYEKQDIRKLSTKHKREISEGARIFLENISNLFQSSVTEMKTSPEDAIRHEEDLRKIFNRHSELSDYSNFSQETNENQFNKDISYFDDRIKELRKWETAIHDIEAEGRDYIEKMQEETDELLLKDLKDGQEKQEAAVKEIEVSLLDLEALRKKHIDEERDVRVKRYKTEQQLINVLRLYDRDLIERQNVYDDKKIALEEERKLLDEFQLKYDEQTLVYNNLLAEKNEFEEKLRQGRLYEIRCKIAARKIQKCFKRYIALAGLSKTDSRKSRKTGRKAK